MVPATCTTWLGAGYADTDRFRDEIGGAKNTPEQLFADSSLVLRHDHTGTTISFTAKAALQAWQAARVPAVKVLSAQAWMSTREKDVAAHQAVTFDYDWWVTQRAVFLNVVSCSVFMLNVCV